VLRDSDGHCRDLGSVKVYMVNAIGGPHIFFGILGDHPFHIDHEVRPLLHVQWASWGAFQPLFDSPIEVSLAKTLVDLSTDTLNVLAANKITSVEMP
jgi:hypothetical protein